MNPRPRRINYTLSTLTAISVALATTGIASCRRAVDLSSTMYAERDSEPIRTTYSTEKQVRID